VTSPNAQSGIAAIAEFEKQDWIQAILKANPAGQQDNEKMYVHPNLAFPFQDNISVGTIHRANATKSPAALALLQLEFHAIRMQQLRF
jgi:hypothetical protein